MSERIVTWGAKGLAPVWELAASALADVADPLVETIGDELESVPRADWRLLEPELMVAPLVR